MPAKSNPWPGSERELVVMFKPEVGLRASRGEAVGESRPRVRLKREKSDKEEARKEMSGARVASFNSLLKSNRAALAPVFGAEDRLEFALSNLKAGGSGADISNMSSFYRVTAEDKKLDKLAEELLNLNYVDGAYVKPAVEPPVALPGGGKGYLPGYKPPPAPLVTPDFQSRQIYLNAAPEGIDARFAWTKPGGKGQGVQIIDIEGGWQLSHEALLQNQGGLVKGINLEGAMWRNHGTAVLGEFSGDETGSGVMGICPQANARAISHTGPGQTVAQAIRDGADFMRPGDILLLEMHGPGPHFDYWWNDGQLGYIAVEFWPDNFAAIAYASWKGILVVEAAGNGAENFDDPLYEKRPSGFPTTWRNPFNLANPQSGAIIVGAGAPPPGTHGRDHGADRSRLDFSNYGARVDVQGWGREVTSAGYGDLQSSEYEDRRYTDIFSGTSSASPIVVGALGCLQGMLRAAEKPLLTSATARSILRQTGSPQQDEAGRLRAQRIGHRPDLRQAYNKLFASKPVVKDGKGTPKDSGKNSKGGKGKGKGK